MSNQSALAICKLRILAALQADLTPPATVPKMTVDLINALSESVMPDFLSENDFNPAIAAEFVEKLAAEMLLRDTLVNIQAWLAIPFDRLDNRFSASYRYPLSGPNAVTANVREKNMNRESSLIAAAMTHAPESTMVTLSSWTEKNLSWWRPLANAYWAGGGMRPLTGLLTPSAQDEFVQATLSESNPRLREFLSIDEREVVHTFNNAFLLSSASDLTPLETAFQKIAMKSCWIKRLLSTLTT
jgi:hypothetical protein